MADDTTAHLFAPPDGHFRGHDRNKLFLLEPDAELTQVGPGTPGGEYLRRFWHPIALTSMVSELPFRLRRLGEDLILFRDGAGQYGLLHLYCAHRNTSLEYGIIEETGIRCCYHGWLFGTDGTILETPGEPATSTIRKTRCQGAYPVIEYQGMIFAYFGPAAEMPRVSGVRHDGAARRQDGAAADPGANATGCKCSRIPPTRIT